MVAKKTNGKIAPTHPPIPASETATKLAPQASSSGSVSGAGKRGSVDPTTLTAAQVAEMKKLGIEYSEDVEERHLKIMLWGDSGTRKTETVLRNFPNVLLIDAEGNSDMCVRNPKIPPFQRVKTQDSRKVLSVLDAAGKGLIRMPDGSPIETVCIDSVSVLWGVQQEVAASLAEQRALKYNKTVEDANTTQNDWGRAKRPLKAILNRFSKGAIKILVLIAREKDLVKERPDGSLEKQGLTYDAVKNTHYDMNLTLHLFWDSPDKRRWQYQVTKVQGPTLGETFPDGSTGTAIPFDKLWEFADKLNPVGEETDEDESLPDQIAASLNEVKIEHTQSNLIKYATSKKFNASQLGTILKNAGFSGFDASRWDEMIQAIDNASHDE